MSENVTSEQDGEGDPYGVCDVESVVALNKRLLAAGAYPSNAWRSLVCPKCHLSTFSSACNCPYMAPSSVEEYAARGFSEDLALAQKLIYGEREPFPGLKVFCSNYGRRTVDRNGRTMASTVPVEGHRAVYGRDIAHELRPRNQNDLEVRRVDVDVEKCMDAQLSQPRRVLAMSSTNESNQRTGVYRSKAESACEENPSKSSSSIGYSVPPNCKEQEEVISDSTSVKLQGSEGPEVVAGKSTKPLVPHLESRIRYSPQELRELRSGTVEPNTVNHENISSGRQKYSRDELFNLRHSLLNDSLDAHGIAKGRSARRERLGRNVSDYANRNGHGVNSAKRDMTSRDHLRKMRAYYSREELLSMRFASSSAKVNHEDGAVVEQTESLARVANCRDEARSVSNETCVSEAEAERGNTAGQNGSMLNSDRNSPEHSALEKPQTHIVPEKDLCHSEVHDAPSLIVQEAESSAVEKDGHVYSCEKLSTVQLIQKEDDAAFYKNVNENRREPADFCSKVGVFEMNDSQIGKLDKEEHSISKSEQIAESLDAAHFSNSDIAPANTGLLGTEESTAGEWTERLFYSREHILSLRHNRMDPTPNAFGISKEAFAAENTFVEEDEPCELGPDGIPRTRDVLLQDADGNISFEALMLPRILVEGLRCNGFVKPSPVQYRGIPLGRLGVDLIAQAKSGTGKTVVFSVIALELILESIPEDSSLSSSALPLSRGGSLSVLVLAPTRELATQIRDVMRLIAGDKLKDVVKLFVGGTPERHDRDTLKNGRGRIAVGTPGRVDSLLRKGYMDSSTLRLLVLDEADKLLEDGFVRSISEICSMLPATKQTLAFSATYSRALVSHLRRVMRAPQLIALGSDGETSSEHAGRARAAVLRGVAQRKASLPWNAGDRARRFVLLRVLAREPFAQCVVFCPRGEDAETICGMLKRQGYAAESLSAKKDAKGRVTAFENARKGSANVLVVTDVLARGVDLPACNLVVQYGVPADVATYLHRVGRAGRFGRRARAVVIAQKDEQRLREIESRIGSIAEWEGSEDLTEIEALGEQFVEDCCMSKEQSEESQMEDLQTQDDCYAMRDARLGGGDSFDDSAVSCNSHIVQDIVQRAAENSAADRMMVQNESAGNLTNAARTIYNDTGSTAAVGVPVPDVAYWNAFAERSWAHGYHDGYTMAIQSIDQLRRQLQ